MYERVLNDIKKNEESFFRGGAKLDSYITELVHWEDTEDEWSGPVYRVWKFTDPATGESCLVKFNGYYKSHWGSEYTHVSPCQAKTITKLIYE